MPTDPPQDPTSSDLGLRDFEGTPVVGPGGKVGYFRWSEGNAAAGNTPLSGWQFLSPNSSPVPVTPGTIFVGGDNMRYTIGAQGTVINKQVADKNKVGVSGSWQPDPNIPGLINLIDENGQIVQTREGSAAGAGAGSGRTPQPYGFNAPDPKGAADLMMTHWIDQINASKGVFDMDAAVSQFKQDYNKFLADTQYREEDLLSTQNRAENEDRRLREAQQAANRISIANEAGTRGRSLMQDYLPYAIPGAQAMNFGGLRIPMMQTSPNQIFQSQPGGPGDLNAIPNINPNPAIPYRQPNLMGSIQPMPGFPTPPPYTPPPDIAALIAQTQAGSGPMGWS